MRRIILALVVAIALPVRAASPEDIAKVFDMLYAVSDAAAILEGLEDGGKLPSIKGPEGLSRAKFGDDGLVEYLVDPWGTPLHIESAAGKGYVIAAAGSDRKFAPSTWSTPAKTASAADDVVLRDGELVRSPEEWAMAAANLTIDGLKAHGARSRHARTIGDLRSIISALQAYEIDAGKLPSVSDLEGLAKSLEPSYVPKLPRTDGWGRKLDFAMDSTLDGYSLASAGADGEHGTDDDIVVEDHEIVKGNELPAGDRIAEAWTGFKAAQLRLETARNGTR